MSKPRIRLARLLAAFALALLAVAPAAADPRPPEAMDAAGIRLALEKLNVVGSALYLGAHPDDENSAVLAWLSEGRKVRSAYLALTRGDGGQNLIGTDLGERLGVIRTQELLAARRVDGGEQFFTRAVDFGFSKNPDETLAIWGRDSILADVVWVIRRFQPDVIITRFRPDSTAGHGHHTASAILAEEAFRAAADPARFPGQLRWVKPWQATRLVWNAYRFGAAGPDTTPGRLQVDLGAYEPLLGRSFTEIAGESRSMHKTQGFGSAERRGSWTNAFEHRAGTRATRDLFDGVDLSWSRVPGGAALTPLFAQALREFQPGRPQAILPLLLRAHAILSTLPGSPIVERKRADLMDVIRACDGLWLEADAGSAEVSPGSTLEVVASALLRTDAPLRLESVELERSDGGPAPAGHAAARTLPPNQPVADTLRFAVPRDLPESQPYWLRAPAARGAFAVSDPQLAGVAENPPALTARFTLSASGQRLVWRLPVVYRWTDPVRGERYRDLAIVPPVAMRFDDRTTLFPGSAPREMRVRVTSADVPARGTLRLMLPAGWRAEPAAANVLLAAGGQDTLVAFRVTPGPGASGKAVAAFFVPGRRYDEDRVEIDYPHVPVQVLLPPAAANLVHTDLKTAGREIAYLMGAGDEVPDALRQMGYAVTMLTDDDVESGDLSRFDAIVEGVRACNTRPRLLAHQRRLLDWVAAGGRLVVQYQTPEKALQDRLGPWPFTVSRDRVTVEEAPVRIANPEQPLLTTPNRITAADFDRWVQERGLWFANPWDPRYQTVLSCNDPGEPPRDGGLLYARYGRGVFIYTGYAFFRQLPAGVPGAWRLFANLVSAPGNAAGSAPRP